RARAQIRRPARQRRSQHRRARCSQTFSSVPFPMFFVPCFQDSKYLTVLLHSKPGYGRCLASFFVVIYSSSVEIQPMSQVKDFVMPDFPSVSQQLAVALMDAWCLRNPEQIQEAADSI